MEPIDLITITGYDYPIIIQRAMYADGHLAIIADCEDPDLGGARIPWGHISVNLSELELAPGYFVLSHDLTPEMKELIIDTITDKKYGRTQVSFGFATSEIVRLKDEFM